MTTFTADPLSMMEEALRDLADCAKTVEAEHNTERKINKVILFEPLGSRVCAYRKVLEEIRRECQESIERFRKQFEIALIQVQRVTKHMVHRAQGRSSGAGKSAAKKSTSASSGGGDGGGDGDGPERTRAKRTKHPKPRNTSLQRSPNTSPGEIAPPPRHPPSLLTQRLGLIAVLCIVNWLAAILFAQIDEPQMAWAAIGFISLLIRSLIKPLK